MKTFAVYQINTHDLKDEINRLGWSESFKRYPKVEAKQDLLVFGSEKFEPSMMYFFDLVAFVDGNDPEDVFKLTNAPAEFLEREFGPDWKHMVRRIETMYSLSVGDIVVDVDTAETFMVESVGFKKLENV